MNPADKQAIIRRMLSGDFSLKHLINEFPQLREPQINREMQRLRRKGLVAFKRSKTTVSWFPTSDGALHLATMQ